MRKLKSRLTFGLVALASLLLVACGGNQNIVPEGSAKFAYQIKSVDVQYDKSLAAEKSSRLDKLNGKSDLTNEIASVLKGVNKWNADSSKEMKVTITNFHIRNGAAAFWLGFMAGVDSLDVSVEVSEKGQVVKTIKTGITTGLGGWGYAAQEKRFNRMVDGLARRIITEL